MQLEVCTRERDESDGLEVCARERDESDGQTTHAQPMHVLFGMSVDANISQ
jgi:hypothetical protein